MSLQEPTFDDLMHVMATCRSVRKFQHQHVDRTIIENIVTAGTYASNPRNSQPWHFVLVDNDEIKTQIAEFIAPRAAEVEEAIPRLRTPQKQKMHQDAADLIRSIGHAPAIIFVCGVEMEYGPGFDSREMILSATYAAAQNILIAARAAGLGAAYTTLHIHARDQIEKLLELPKGTNVEVTIPLGYPLKPFGPVNRKQVDEVSSWNSFNLK